MVPYEPICTTVRYKYICTRSTTGAGSLLVTPIPSYVPFTLIAIIRAHNARPASSTWGWEVRGAVPGRAQPGCSRPTLQQASRHLQPVQPDKFLTEATMPWCTPALWCTPCHAMVHTGPVVFSHRSPKPHSHAVVGCHESVCMTTSVMQWSIMTPCSEGSQVCVPVCMTTSVSTCSTYSTYLYDYVGQHMQYVLNTMSQSVLGG